MLQRFGTAEGGRNIQGLHTELFPTNDEEVAAAVKLSNQFHSVLEVQSGSHFLQPKRVPDHSFVLNLSNYRAPTAAPSTTSSSSSSSVVEVGPPVDPAKAATVTVLASATVKSLASDLAAATGPGSGGYLPTGENAQKCVVSDFFSNEPSILGRNFGSLRDHVSAIHYIDRATGETAEISAAQAGKANFLEQVSDLSQKKDAGGIITLLQFETVPFPRAGFWLIRAVFPLWASTDVALVLALLSPGTLPETLDATVSVCHAIHDMPMVFVTVAGPEQNGYRALAKQAVEAALAKVSCSIHGQQEEALVNFQEFVGSDQVTQELARFAYEGSLQHELPGREFSRVLSTVDIKGSLVDSLCNFVNLTMLPTAEHPLQQNLQVSIQARRLSSPDKVGVKVVLYTAEELKLDSPALRQLTAMAALLPKEQQQQQQQQLLRRQPAPAVVRSALLGLGGAMSAGFASAAAVAAAARAEDAFPAAPTTYAAVRAPPSLLSRLVTTTSSQHVPNFAGETFMQGDSGYTAAAHQYASSSFPPQNTQPFMVAVPTSVSDIQNLVQYAKNMGKKLIGRSGGHQYCGMSSGGQDTIVVSMSHESFTQISVDGNIATVGPGALLTDIATAFKNAGITIPHGECPRVAIGGHIQSGGYGHLLRNFGLAIDHVLSFDMVLADGTFVTATRPAKGSRPGSGANANDDLYWAVLGGGPGSFGILTTVRLDCVRDSDNPNSYGFKSSMFYDKNAFKAALSIAAEWTQRNSKGELDAGVDLCMTVTSADWKNIRPAMMLVEAVHGNSKIPFDPKVFDDIEQKVKDAKPFLKPLWVAYKGPQTLSFMSDSFVRRAPSTTSDGREFPYPYNKRLSITNIPLSAAFVNGFVDLVQKVVDMSGVHLVFQMFIGGGAYAAPENPGFTAICHRKCMFGLVFDIFYSPGGEAKAAGLQDDMERLLALYSNGQDIRMLWGSYGDTDMSKQNVQDYYYDRATYAKLSSFKQRIDPTDLFHTEFTVQLPKA